MRYLEKIITTTSDVFFKANSHNTVWMSHTNLCVTSLNLFRISPWQGKRAKICFKCNPFCLLKSPARKMKHKSLSKLKHMILISKIQKMGRLKCHTQKFDPPSILLIGSGWFLLCTMNNMYLTQVFGATFASFASSKQDFSGKYFVCDMMNVTHKG